MNPTNMWRAALVIVVCLLIALGIGCAISGLFSPMAAQKPRVPYLAILLATLIPLGFLLIDWITFEMRNAAVPAGSPKKEYFPNLRVLSLGGAFGASSAVLLILGNTTAVLLEKAPTNTSELWQQIALLLIPAVLLAFLVSELAKVSANE